MADVIELEDLQDGYLELVDWVMTNGDEVAPRGMPTREVTNATVVLRNPLRSIPVGVGRGINLAIGAAESAMLLGGVNDAALLTHISANFARFVEHDRFYGAYGPRVYQQIPMIIKQLIADPDTRQAGIAIFRPDDLSLGTVDLPCTLELQYQLRGGKLNAITYMRSNDCAWGVTYDFWQFTSLQAAIARALGVEVGQYIHCAASLHVYIERDAELLTKLHAYDGAEHPPPPVRMDYEPQLRTLGQALGRWGNANSTMEAAVGLRDWVPSHDSAGPCPRWYRDQLVPHLTRNRLCPTCRYVLPHSYFPYESSKRACKWCARDIRNHVPVGTTSRMMLRQRGACAICKADLGENFHLDHDHSTGVARGLLCGFCNQGLGQFRDDSARLVRAAHYLDADVEPNEWAADFDFLYRARPRDRGITDGRA